MSTINISFTALNERKNYFLCSGLPFAAFRMLLSAMTYNWSIIHGY